jgi:glycosyltransferase involved in cell wall biosynthesis
MMLCDARWIGPHGIGRFAREVLDRLPAHGRVTEGPRLLSPLDSTWLSFEIARRRPNVFFSPGFNPPVFCSAALVFTIHDLIHLRIPEEGSALKRLYFDRIVLPSARRAFRVITVSEYSRREILDWSGLPEDRVVVTGNGVDSSFCPTGPSRHFDGRYLLYVGNRKAHKNLDRLFQAFRMIEANDAKLLLSGLPDADIVKRIGRAGISHRVEFTGPLTDAELPALYRGAEALVLPSLMEGFGLPVVEAMASGTPVIAARSSSLPEIAGDAAVFFDPLDVEDMRRGMDLILGDGKLREQLRQKGLRHVRRFTWEGVADRVGSVLELAEGTGRAPVAEAACQGK